MECPKAICKHLQILLLVGCANSEALHQRKSSLVPFFSEMLQRSCVAQQSWGYSVFVFFYQLEADRFGHADRVEKYLQVTCLELCPHGRLLQCLQTGCRPGFLQPRAAKAVSHLAPPCTAPRGMSSTAVT